MNYCQAVELMVPGERRDLHKNYHDNHYGFAIDDDNQLFGRLVMEINQAGLSWEIILKKEPAFRLAYDNFEIAKVANYGQAERQRLLADAGIIRNRLKVDAAIANAQTIHGLQQQFGSFKAWLDEHRGLSKEDWVKLFARNFKFTGGEIVGEFLMSTGYLPGAHSVDCPIYRQLQDKHFTY